MACVAFTFSWRVSPSSLNGVCCLQVFMACVAFKFWRRVSPLSFHGVCRLQVFMACVTFRFVSLFSWRSSSSFLFLWGVWLEWSFYFHGMCCVISFPDVYRAGFYSALCYMMCVYSELCSSWFMRAHHCSWIGNWYFIFSQRWLFWKDFVLPVYIACCCLENLIVFFSVHFLFVHVLSPRFRHNQHELFKGGEVY